MKIAVMGYGTIGSGVVEIIRKNQAQIADRAGEEVDIKYVVCCTCQLRARLTDCVLYRRFLDF